MAALAGSALLIGLALLLAFDAHPLAAATVHREPVELAVAVVMAAYVGLAWSAARPGAGRAVVLTADVLASVIQVLCVIGGIIAFLVLTRDARTLGLRGGLPWFSGTATGLISLAAMLAVVAIQAHRWLKKRLAEFAA